MGTTSFVAGFVYSQTLNNIRNLPLSSLEPLIFAAVSVALTLIIFFFIDRKSKRETEEIIRRCEENAHIYQEAARQAIERAKNKKEPKE